MSTLGFVFADVGPGHDDIPNDEGRLSNFVARTFGVRVGGAVLFDEPEFPVVELAVELDEWLAYGLPHDGALDYEVTGGEPGTLTIRPGPAGWLVGSALHEGGPVSPTPLTGAAVSAGIHGFIGDLVLEAARGHGIDLRSALRQAAEDRATDVNARRRRRDAWGIPA